MTSMKAYASDLSDQEWAILEPLIPKAKPGGRPRSVDMRQILNGIFYMLRSGCAWRLLPHDYPAWSTVYDYFRKWRNASVWEQIVTTLRERLRVQAWRKATPSGVIIDSQSVKTTERGGPVMATWDIHSKNGHLLLPNHAFPLVPTSMERQGGRAPLALSERKSSS
jgi:putative transposase